MIFAFFGAVFGAITLHTQFGVPTPLSVLTFIIFAAIALPAWSLSKKVTAQEANSRVISWSSAFEGIGIFIAVNVVENLHKPQLLLPVIAVIVALHFVPMAYAIPFRFFYGLAAVLGLLGILGFLLAEPLGPRLAGIGCALTLWTSAILALRRDQERLRMSIDAPSADKIS